MTGGRYGRVLVTGAAGFLGSFLCAELLRRNYKVIGVDNFFRGKRENIKHLGSNQNFEFYEIDLMSLPNIGRLKKILRSQGTEAIFHFAAINGTKYFYDRPFDVLRTNTELTINLLGILSAVPTLKKVVYASTSEVYSEPLEIPTPENQPIILRTCSDRHSYAASKAIGEFYVRLFSQQKGIHYLILRIFNTYGERMDTSEYGQVIPEFIRKILTEDQFTLIGGGEQTRSFCYVTDNVKMAVSAAEKVDNEILNIGNDEEVKIIQLAEMLHKIAKKPFNPKFLPARQHDHQRRCPCLDKMKRLTGEHAKIYLFEGLKRTFQYYKEPL